MKIYERYMFREGKMLTPNLNLPHKLEKKWL